MGMAGYRDKGKCVRWCELNTRQKERDRSKGHVVEETISYCLGVLKLFGFSFY